MHEIAVEPAVGCLVSGHFICEIHIQIYGESGFRFDEKINLICAMSLSFVYCQKAIHFAEWIWNQIHCKLVANWISTKFFTVCKAVIVQLSQVFAVIMQITVLSSILVIMMNIWCLTFQGRRFLCFKGMLVLLCFYCISVLIIYVCQTCGLVDSWSQFAGPSWSLLISKFNLSTEKKHCYIDEW